MLRNRFIRWLDRHNDAVLEALRSGPKTGKALKAAGVLSKWNCSGVLSHMERNGLIEGEIDDPEDHVYPPRRVYRVVG